MTLQRIAAENAALEACEMTDGLDAYIQATQPNRLLLLPPDQTRLHSGAGALCAYLHQTYAKDIEIDLMPAVGSHMQMHQDQLAWMFPGIPQERFLHHHWRKDCVSIGQVPGSLIEKLSKGLLSYPINVELNQHLCGGRYDAMLSLGQVVPHEVAGMSNYSKNILVGVGGSQMIHRTHFLGAVCGMEQAMGRDHAPVREVFDWAHRAFLADLPLTFAYTVIARRSGADVPVSFFLGPDREAFERAVACSQRENIVDLPRRPHTIVCTLDALEYQSTWVGNKAIYRTRMALADGGRLVIFAPGVRMFGEDPQIDSLLRKVGYVGRERVLAAMESLPELRANLSAAAHLIHGSSEGRFSIAYAAPQLGREALQCQAHYQYLDWNEGLALYQPHALQPGWNEINGQEVYFIDQPALGLWRAP